MCKTKYTLIEAQKLMQIKEWQKASNIWEEIRKKSPDNPEGFIQGGIALRNLGRVDEALELFEISIAKHENSLNATIEKAHTLMGVKRWNEASNIWMKIRIDYPHRADGFIQGGVALKNLGRVDEALKLFEISIVKHKNTPKAKIRKARILMERKEWEDASNIWIDIRKNHSVRPEGFIQGGIALRNLGRVDEALELFETSILMHKNEPRNRIQKAQTLMQMKRWEDASNVWKEFTKDYPDRPVGFIQAGAVLRKLGKLEEAKKEFLLALKLDEHNKKVINYLIEIEKTL